MGLTTMGMMFVALGLFFSAITRQQIVAAVGTFVTMFGLIVITMFAAQVAAEGRSPWFNAIQFVAIVNQAYRFGSGELDVRFLALHLSVAAFFLYLTVKVVEFSRGR